MSVGHDLFDDSTPTGRFVRNYGNALDAVNDSGPKIILMITQMIDGDGSQDAHYAYLVKRMKFLGYADGESGTPTAAQLAVAHAWWNEFQSVNGKLQTDASVSSVLAAIKQYLAKTR